MKKQKSHSASETYLHYLFEISPFFIGLSAIYSSLFFGIAAAIGILILLRLHGGLRFYRNSSSRAGLLLLIGGVLSTIFGIDHGTGAEGLLVLLSAAVFVVLWMQIASEGWESALGTMPETGTVLVIVCAFFYLIPGTRSFLFQSGRLNGLFQYANTMALYLLLCLLLFLREEGKRREKIWNVVIPAVLLVGILWTGSRITFVLTVFVFLYETIRRRDKRWLLFVGGGILLLAVIGVALTGRTASFGRFLTSSTRLSTLIGRFLYWADALPLILQHPLGLGYLGYSQIELASQHGFYYVEFVHNEILQCFLDYGWIGGAGFLWLLVHNIRTSRGTARTALLLMTIHLCFDFDLQFFPMIWLLILFMNWTDGKEVVLSRRKPSQQRKGKTRRRMETEENESTGRGERFGRVLFPVCLAVFSISAFWIGLSDLLDYAGHPDIAAEIYPFDYKYFEKLMYADGSYETAEADADRVLRMNPCHFSACLLKANAAKDRGDMKKALPWERKAVSLAPYQKEVWNDYGEKLIQAAEEAEQTGDRKSQKKYEKELASIPDQIGRVKAGTNPLAYRITDKPDFTLSDEVQDAIERLR